MLVRFLPFWITILLSPSESCVELQGIGDDPSDTFSPSTIFVPTGFVWFQYFASLGSIGGLNTRLETAVLARETVYDAIGYYSTAAAFEATSLEFFARQDVSDNRRRCQPIDPTNTTQTDLFTLHRSVALAYAIYYINYFRYPDANTLYYNNFMFAIGLDPFICGNGNNNTSDGCENDVSTPWGLAYVIGKELNDFGAADGWNAKGEYNRDYNKIPFSDFRDINTKYIPKNNPWYISDIERWQPLLESDSLGFLFYQEHNCPHAGFTGKSFIYTNEEFCLKRVNEPEYDYNVEMELTFERLANLNDEQKMEIELWDDKTRLNVALFRLQQSKGVLVDSIEYIETNLIDFLVVYETILISWKEKMNYDKIRPTSIVHELLGDALITSYAGVSPEGESFGTQTLLGKDWEPYIRTMPHSEYPSASACICEAFSSAMIEYFGNDNITEISGFDSVGFNFDAFSSKYEPLSTPSEPIRVRYDSFSQISERCGESRLEGGMHFTASVSAGRELCSDIGTRVTQTVKALANGMQPQFMVEFDTSENSFVERFDCYDGPAYQNGNGKGKGNGNGKQDSSSESSSH